MSAGETGCMVPNPIRRVTAGGTKSQKRQAGAWQRPGGGGIRLRCCSRSPWGHVGAGWRRGRGREAAPGKASSMGVGANSLGRSRQRPGCSRAAWKMAMVSSRLQLRPTVATSARPVLCAETCWLTGTGVARKRLHITHHAAALERLHRADAGAVKLGPRCPRVGASAGGDTEWPLRKQSGVPGLFWILEQLGHARRAPVAATRNTASTRLAADAGLARSVSMCRKCLLVTITFQCSRPKCRRAVWSPSELPSHRWK